MDDNELVRDLIETIRDDTRMIGAMTNILNKIRVCYPHIYGECINEKDAEIIRRGGKNGNPEEHNR